MSLWDILKAVDEPRVSDSPMSAALSKHMSPCYIAMHRLLPFNIAMEMLHDELPMNQALPLARS